MPCLLFIFVHIYIGSHTGSLQICRSAFHSPCSRIFLFTIKMCLRLSLFWVIWFHIGSIYLLRNAKIWIFGHSLPLPPSKSISTFCILVVTPEPNPSPFERYIIGVRRLVYHDETNQFAQPPFAGFFVQSPLCRSKEIYGRAKFRQEINLEFDFLELVFRRWNSSKLE